MHLVYEVMLWNTKPGMASGKRRKTLKTPLKLSGHHGLGNRYGLWKPCSTGFSFRGQGAR